MALRAISPAPCSASAKPGASAATKAFDCAALSAISLSKAVRESPPSPALQKPPLLPVRASPPEAAGAGDAPPSTRAPGAGAPCCLLRSLRGPLPPPPPVLTPAARPLAALSMPSCRGLARAGAASGGLVAPSEASMLADSWSSDFADAADPSSAARLAAPSSNSNTAFSNRPIGSKGSSWRRPSSGAGVAPHARLQTFARSSPTSAPRSRRSVSKDSSPSTALVQARCTTRHSRRHSP
mmetsp:Transcript_35421/g.102269  ORF Transcript_35421/g.102269 Transcript_35421/m.102269 type:complete len:239 (+) Transcript_35421:806-1522(+)